MHDELVRGGRLGAVAVMVTVMALGCGESEHGAGALAAELRLRRRDPGFDAGRDGGQDAGAGRDGGQDAGAGLDGGSATSLDSGSATSLDSGSATSLDGGSATSLDGGSATSLDGGSATLLDSGSSVGVDASQTLQWYGTVGSGSHLYVVAHPDDDLLFMHADVDASFAAGLPVQVVYLTSGDGGQPPSYWQSREAGVRSAYAAMARVTDAWDCASIAVAGKTVERCTLIARPLVSLVFVRLPDTGLAALWAPDSGAPFWVTPVPSQRTVDGSNEYTRPQLVALLAAIVADRAPGRVGMQDGTLAYGEDHQDHIASAMFVLEALHASGRAAGVRMYRGYSMYQTWSPVPEPLPRNLSVAQHDENVRVMRAYGASPSPGDLYDEWCWRQYFSQAMSGGPNTLSGDGLRCLAAAGGLAFAAPCSGAAEQRWEVRPEGLVVTSAGLCLTLGSGGTTAMVQPCAGSESQRWTLLDDGQLRGVGATCLALGSDLTTVSPAVCAADQVGTRLAVRSTQRWIR